MLRTRPHRFRLFGSLPISIRLTLWYGLTLLVLLSLFAVFCYTNFHLSLHRDFDRHLTHERRELMPFVEVLGGRPVLSSLDDLRSVAYQTDGIYGTYVRLLTPSGEILYRSPNFDGHAPLPVRLPGEVEDAFVSRTWEDEPARVHFTPISTDEGRVAGWLEVTGFEWSLHRELHRLAFSLALGILISVALAIAGGYWLARRALRPVSALTRAAGRVGATDLSTRLPADFGVRDELTALAETFNAMIARLEASFRRERRFTSNAAHELLTPLSTMRSEVEVTLRREREPAAYHATLRTVLADVERLTATVKGLMQLAQAERLQEDAARALDLGALTAEHVRRYEHRATEKEITLAVAVKDDLIVRADEVHLGEALDNLLDNALKYTPAGGRVAVTVERAGEEARLSVSDTGPGFDPETASHLFDRFYRADTPAVQAQSGSGLGLSIVQTVVEAYGGSVAAQSAGPGRGSTFAVRLPLEEPSGSPS